MAVKKIWNFIADTPVTRPLATLIASLGVSIMLKRRVRIFFDSVWLRTDGRVTVALGSHLQLIPSQIRQWKPDATDVVDAVAKWWFIHYHPRPGDIIVDVGAGTGGDTLCFGKLVGAEGLVYSFEAHPATFSQLEKVLEYSDCKNVTAVYGAVYSETKMLQIEDLEEDHWQENSIMAAENKPGARLISIPGFALDEIESLKAHPRINFLKMNIEGAEINALRGMPRTLEKVEYACIACHDFLSEGNPKMKTREICRKILLEAGFKVFEMNPESPPWQRDHLHAVRTLDQNF